MKKILILLIIILIIVPVYGQDELNLGMKPYNSPTPVLSQEIWETLQTDYFSNEIEVTRLTVDAETFFQDEIVNNSDDCVGSLPSQPTYQIQWDRAALDENLPVRFFITSGEDVTLVIHEPDGDWYCADDYKTVLDPMIEIPSLRSGDYLLWVGSKQEESLFVGRIYVSIGNHTPLRPPPSCCEGLSFSNPAQSATEATITYVEVDEIDPDKDAGIRISTDITFRGEGGTTFIVEAIIFDMETNDVIEGDRPAIAEDCEISSHLCDSETLRRNSSRRDYSPGSRKGPVEFLIDSLAYDELGEDYYIELRVSVLDDGKIGELADSTIIKTTDN